MGGDRAVPDVARNEHEVDLALVGDRARPRRGRRGTRPCGRGGRGACRCASPRCGGSSCAGERCGSEPGERVAAGRRRPPPPSWSPRAGRGRSRRAAPGSPAGRSPSCRASAGVRAPAWRAASIRTRRARPRRRRGDRSPGSRRSRAPRAPRGSRSAGRRRAARRANARAARCRSACPSAGPVPSRGAYLFELVEHDHRQRQPLAGLLLLLEGLAEQCAHHEPLRLLVQRLDRHDGDGRRGSASMRWRSRRRARGVRGATPRACSRRMNARDRARHHASGPGLVGLAAVLGLEEDLEGGHERWRGRRSSARPAAGGDLLSPPAPAGRLRRVAQHDRARPALPR